MVDPWDEVWIGVYRHPDYETDVFLPVVRSDHPVRLVMIDQGADFDTVPESVEQWQKWADGIREQLIGAPAEMVGWAEGIIATTLDLIAK